MNKSDTTIYTTRDKCGDVIDDLFTLGVDVSTIYFSSSLDDKDIWEVSMLLTEEQVPIIVEYAKRT